MGQIIICKLVGLLLKKLVVSFKQAYTKPNFEPTAVAAFRFFYFSHFLSFWPEALTMSSSRFLCNVASVKRVDRPFVS